MGWILYPVWGAKLLGGAEFALRCNEALNVDAFDGIMILVF